MSGLEPRLSFTVQGLGLRATGLRFRVQSPCSIWTCRAEDGARATYFKKECLDNAKTPTIGPFSCHMIAN